MALLCGRRRRQKRPTAWYADGEMRFGKDHCPSRNPTYPIIITYEMRVDALVLGVARRRGLERPDRGRRVTDAFIRGAGLPMDN
eukprot:282553-Pyramimonas_sp.AAC.1